VAFPTIQTADTKNGVVTSNSSSWTLAYPTNLVSGDLILAFVASDGGSSTFTFPADWTRQRNIDAGAVSGCVGWKISTGSETGTFTLNQTASEQGSWRIFRITGWYGSGIPGDNDIGTGGGVESVGGAMGVASTTISGPSSTPDPPSWNPFNWGVEDTLWFAACWVDTSRTISVYPLPDNNTADVSGGAGGATLGICTDELAQASLNPGTFTISASDDWGAATVAVRPGSSYQPRHAASDSALALV
jgi:hypothetical protein